MTSVRSLSVLLAGALAMAAVVVAGSGSHPASAQPDCDTPAGISGCWNVDLFDDFVDTTLDLNTWEPGWFVDDGYSAPVNGRENACYHTDQVAVTPGQLEITLDTSADPLCLDKQGEIAPFVGGLVSGRDAINDPAHPARLDDTFYVEARVKLPSVDGQVRNWPAFWTAGFGPWPVTGEIDVLEGLEGAAKFNYHFACPVGGNCQAGAQQHPAPSSDGEWHTYGAYRQLATTSNQATITYFFDGAAVGTVTERVVDAPQYLILTYTSHESHDVTTAGATMLVDWVRTWSPRDPSPGDVSCSLGVSIVDALLITQYNTGVRSDAGGCPLQDPITQLNAAAGDINLDERTDVVDALLIARCSIGIEHPAC